MFKMENGDIKIEKNNFIILSEKDKVLQNVSEKIKHIQGTYNLRKEIGIPWLDYIGKLNSVERDELIITYMYEKILEYNGVDVTSIFVEKIKKENREVFFNISFEYLGDKINESIGGIFNAI